MTDEIVFWLLERKGQYLLDMKVREPLHDLKYFQLMFSVKVVDELIEIRRQDEDYRND